MPKVNFTDEINAWVISAKNTREEYKKIAVTFWQLDTQMRDKCITAQTQLHQLEVAAQESDEKLISMAKKLNLTKLANELHDIANAMNIIVSNESLLTNPVEPYILKTDPAELSANIRDVREVATKLVSMAATVKAVKASRPVTSVPASMFNLTANNDSAEPAVPRFIA